MNVMESWLEAVKLYKKSRPKLARAPFINGGLKNIWCIYALLLAIGLLVYFHTERNPTLLENLSVFGGAISWVWGVFLAKERCQQIVYSKQYEVYKIKKYPLLRRESILRYAILCELLGEKGYHYEKTEKLLAAATAANDPRKTNIASKSLTIGLLTSAAITITTNLLEGTEIWKNNKGVLYLIPIAITLYIAFLIIDFIQSKEHRNATILSFLSRAVIDLRENERTEKLEESLERKPPFEDRTKKILKSHHKRNRKTGNSSRGGGARADKASAGTT